MTYSSLRISRSHSPKRHSHIRHSPKRHSPKHHSPKRHSPKHHSPLRSSPLRSSRYSMYFRGGADPDNCIECVNAGKYWLNTTGTCTGSDLFGGIHDIRECPVVATPADGAVVATPVDAAAIATPVDAVAVATPVPRYQAPRRVIPRPVTTPIHYTVLMRNIFGPLAIYYQNNNRDRDNPIPTLYTFPQGYVYATYRNNELRTLLRESALNPYITNDLIVNRGLDIHYTFPNTLDPDTYHGAHLSVYAKFDGYLNNRRITLTTSVEELRLFLHLDPEDNIAALQRLLNYLQNQLGLILGQYVQVRGNTTIIGD